jgi:hypothetical protein
VGAWADLVAAGSCQVGFLDTSLYIIEPLFFFAAMGVGCANPSVDEARLDVIHSSVRGRSEGVQPSVLHASSAAAAPLFGYLAAHSGHAHSLTTSTGNGAGLRSAMLILRVTLVAAGLVLLLHDKRPIPETLAPHWRQHAPRERMPLQRCHAGSGVARLSA